MSGPGNSNNPRKFYYDQNYRSSRFMQYPDHILKHTEELHAQRPENLGDFKKQKREAEEKFYREKCGESSDNQKQLPKVTTSEQNANSTASNMQVPIQKCYTCRKPLEKCRCYQSHYKRK